MNGQIVNDIVGRFIEDKHLKDKQSWLLVAPDPPTMLGFFKMVLGFFIHKKRLLDVIDVEEFPESKMIVDGNCKTLITPSPRIPNGVSLITFADKHICKKHFSLDKGRWIEVMFAQMKRR